MVIIPFKNSIVIYGVSFIFLSFFILIKNIRAISKIALILSIGISLVLLIGAITVLLGYRKDIVLGEIPNIMSFGKTILVLFWAVVGWEVIGNYTSEVENPEKTIKKAITISFLIVNLVYLLIVFSMERIDLEKISLMKNFGENKLAVLLVPAFGSYGVPIMIVTAVALCISTYILFVGSAARLLTTLAEENRAPQIFKKKLQ